MQAWTTMRNGITKKLRRKKYEKHAGKLIGKKPTVLGAY